MTSTEGLDISCDKGNVLVRKSSHESLLELSCPKKVDIVKELDSLPETRTSRVTLIPLLMLILIIILILITLGVVANS